jgi:hypothetical protein
MVSPALAYEPPAGRRHLSDHVRHIVRVADRTLVVLIGAELDRLVGEMHVLDDGLNNGALFEQAAIEIELVASLRPGIVHATTRIIVIRLG